MALETPAIELSPVSLDPARKLRREPPRPWYLRQPRYDDEFDWLTVFYDVFRSADLRHIVLLGPPLRNIAGVVRPAVAKAFGVSRSAISVRDLDRNTQLWLVSHESTANFESWTEHQRLVVQPNLCELFRDKRVVFTVSKDNELQWIRDWTCFYVRKHGADAILLYDNNSTRYSLDEIRVALSGIVGLDTVVVVGWPFKFGPSGGSSKLWDSDFCQYGVIEHARHRFLALAAACVNADIDELVTTPDRSSVFDRAVNSLTGFISYGGDWVENVRIEPPDAPRRHAQFRYRVAHSPTRVRTKWAVVPSHCPPASQWRVHDVSGMRSDGQASQGVLTRHFRAINTNWKIIQWEPVSLTPEHMLDTGLLEWLDGLD